jgi:peptidyl-prolyl cis-trans isomerase B (cyclophilin B)
MKLLIYLFVIFIVACNTEELERLRKQNDELNKKHSETVLQLESADKYASIYKGLIPKLQGLKARMYTDKGIMEIVFFPDKAPLHVMNFVNRAEAGFYNGLQFHRVIPNFMIQGGDPNSKDDNFNDDGSGGPLVAIPHEFNDVKHVPGILSTARTNDLNSGAGSQFFIMHGTTAHLDNQYTVFGQVVKGLEVIDAIVNVPRNAQDHPLKAVRIQRIEVFR